MMKVLKIIIKVIMESKEEFFLNFTVDYEILLEESELLRMIERMISEN